MSPLGLYELIYKLARLIAGILGIVLVLRFFEVTSLNADYLTITLIAVTTWYAWHTYKMSKIMSNQFELERRPLVCFSNVSIETGVHSVGIQNVGKVPTKHMVARLNINGEDRRGDQNDEPIVLFPGKEMSLFSGGILPPGSTIECEIEYWAINATEETYIVARTYEILRTTVGITNDRAT